MSLPSFPDKDNIPSREEAVNQILSSIAMGELGLSHIINAEGEKLQYALGTIPGQSGPDRPATIDELLEINDSIHKTLDNTMWNQYFLKEKLTQALSASTMQGPTGPAGPMTTILGSYNSLEQLKSAHPEGNAGDAYLVGRELYVWNPEANDWISAGDLTGPAGAVGPTGPVGGILDSYDTYDQLVDAHPTGAQCDTYLAGGVLYVWDNTDGTWKASGNMVGPIGPTGASAYNEAQSQGFTGSEEEWLESLVGPQGPVGAILGRVPTQTDLPADPKEGDTYLVGNGELYVWLNGAWVQMGSLLGPTGATGATGDPGDNIGTIAGVVETETDLPLGGDEGELLIVRDYQGGGEPHLFVWDTISSSWEHVGMFEGVIGPTGPTGPVGVVMGSFTSYEALVDAHPTGTQGDTYLVGGSLYIWDGSTWTEVGNLQGPTGAFDTGDKLFSVSGSSGSADVKYNETLEFISSTLDIEVTDNPATVRIDAPSGRSSVLQFSSITPGTVRAYLGSRSQIVTVGLGGTTFTHVVDDPVDVRWPAFSIKVMDGGTVKKVQYSLTITESPIDVSVSTVFARLYTASGFNAAQFYYVEGSEASIEVPYFANVGITYSRTVELSAPIPASSQLMLVFHNISSGGGAGWVTGIMGGTLVIDN